MRSKALLLGAVLTISLSLGMGACSSQQQAQPPVQAPGKTPEAGSAPAGKAPQTTKASPVRGGVINIGVRREAGELDIHKPTIGTTRQYARALYNALFAIDVKGQVTGELVDNWETPDSKTYTLKLRKGVKFHDGTDFNAESVKLNIERILDPATKAFYRSELNGVASVEVVDEYTVRLRLKAPDATLPGRLSDSAGWIVSPAAVKKWGDQFATHPVGTGPFELVEWVKDDHLTLKRFEGYWEKDEQGNQLPYLDGVFFRPIPDATVMLTSLRTGNLDLIESILPSDLATVKSDQNLAVVEGPGSLQVLWLNNEKPPFNNKALRQAVAWAIDQDGIQKAVYYGTGSPGKYLLPPDSWAFDSKGKFYSRDVAKVKEKLAEGGQPSGLKFTALVNNLTVDLQYSQAIKGQLAEVGIDMEIQPLVSTVNADRRLSGDFQGSFSNLTAAGDPDGSISRYVRTGAGVNRVRYSNTKVDGLLDKALEVTSQKERQTLYYQIQEMVLEDSPLVFIHHDSNLQTMNKKVQGFEPSADAFIRLPRLWLKK